MLSQTASEEPRHTRQFFWSVREAPPQPYACPLRAYCALRHASSNSSAALANIHILASRFATLVSIVSRALDRTSHGDAGMACVIAIAIARGTARTRLTQAPGRTYVIADRARIEQGVGFGAGAHAGIGFVWHVQNAAPRGLRVDDAATQIIRRSARHSNERGRNQALRLLTQRLPPSALGLSVGLQVRRLVK